MAFNKNYKTNLPYLNVKTNKIKIKKNNIMKYLYCNETNELLTQSETIIPNERGFFVLEKTTIKEIKGFTERWKLYTPREHLRLEE